MKKHKKYNFKKIETAREDINHASKEIKMDYNFVQNIISKEGYLPVKNPPISRFSL